MIKEWKLKERLTENLLEQLLLSRGIKTDEEKKKFLSPDYEKDLGDPFLMLGMDGAVGRILSAIEKNEKIVVYGDYDADGICGAVVFHDFFKKIGFENFSVYIPDRYLEGYGLNTGAVDEFIKNEVGLVVTIDCGITDVGEIKKLKECGIDTVILDHHEEGVELPPAVAIVDVKQKKDTYPFKAFCGAAVALKTVEAVFAKKNFNVTPGWHKWLLDVVALATITDMVSLTGENRILLKYGLGVLGKTYRVGLNVLFENLKIKKEQINEDDLGFLVGPRINAAGRMGKATMSFDLLTTEKTEEAKWLVERVNEKNEERKSTAENYFNQAVAEVDSKKGQAEIVVVGSRDWVPGLLGIVATKLVEKYKKPVFVWGKGEGANIKGSCRRYDDSVDLVALMASIEEGFFGDRGGHAYSAGFSLDESKVPMLEEKIVKAFSMIKKSAVPEVLFLDAEFSLDDINEKTMAVLEQLKPFGMGNEKPVFFFPGLLVSGSRVLGNGGVHLQLSFKNSKGKTMPAVGFFMRGAVDAGFKEGDRVDLAASMERNFFGGKNELRLRIVDVKISR